MFAFADVSEVLVVSSSEKMSKPCSIIFVSE